ncbi:hypothetical protein K1719_033785 [Acacia pycnantha]|nr:hypothetical protein K1719_033785 [Acacia pycnantha]
MSLLYYGLAVVGTAAIILAVYNLIIFKRCSRRRRRSQSSPSSSSSSSSQISNRATETAMASTRSCDIRLNRNSSLSSFKYKKESGQDCDCDCECPVCLSGFEEGEELFPPPASSGEERLLRSAINGGVAV